MFKDTVSQDFLRAGGETGAEGKQRPMGQGRGDGHHPGQVSDWGRG